MTAARELLCEMLRLFYAKDWVSGTGGGICAVEAPGRMLVAPTGVHKERVGPGDLFVVSCSQGEVLEGAADETLRPSECVGVFGAVIRARAAGSVMHSHGLQAVLAADLAKGSDCLELRGLEMLKGIRGVANTDVHPIPVVDNTPMESQLVGAVVSVLGDPRFAASFAILVRDHGAYIWGADIWEAKRHAEVYHFLFEATYRRARH